jgi:hypothetical protein
MFICWIDKVQSISRSNFLKVRFHTELFKNCVRPGVLQPRISLRSRIQWSKFLMRGSGTLEEFLSGSPFPRR